MVTDRVFWYVFYTMKKNNIKKLALNKESIRYLAKPGLTKIVGGAPDDSDTDLCTLEICASNRCGSNHCTNPCTDTWLTVAAC